MGMSGSPSARAREDARNIDLEPEEVPDMTIVVGMDLHREQITYDLLDMDTGEVRRGRVSPAHGAGCGSSWLAWVVARCR